MSRIIHILFITSLCFSCNVLHAEKRKKWEGGSRSYLEEFYKRLIHGQDLNGLIFSAPNTDMIGNIYKHQSQLTQGYSEDILLSLVEKAESFTDGLPLDTFYHIHFPNGADVYYQIVNAYTFNGIWLPNGNHICFPHIHFYRPAIINDADGYVNIREKADGKSKIVGKLKAGELFYFTPESFSDWYRVYRNEEQPCLGFIHKSRITVFKDFPKHLKRKVRRIRSWH